MNNIIPTFTLKGIDPKLIIEKYNKGDYNNDNHKKLKKIFRVQECPSMRTIYTNNELKPIFADNNTGEIFVTTNKEGFECFSLNGKLKVGGRCKLCHQDFNWEVSGYPVASEEKYISNSSVQNQLYYYFWIAGEACNLRHAYGLLLIQIALGKINRSAEQMIIKLNSLLYPGTELLPPNDPDLFECNGGSVIGPIMDDGEHEYIKTERVVLFPTKNVYKMVKKPRQ